jgi:universal stress protein A
MSDYRHILVAVDFSASADQVVNKARDIAKRNNARLSLLHVVEYMPPIAADYDPMFISNWGVNDELMLERAEQSLKNISEKQNLENAELKVQIGTAKHEISQFVKDNNCDLIVMGSHGRHGINLLLGSTANAILHAMPCDILTIKLEK